MSGAPDGALVLPTIPGPDAFVNAMTVSEPWYVVPCPDCDITAAEDSGSSVRAAQISAVPD